MLIEVNCLAKEHTTDQRPRKSEHFTSFRVHMEIYNSRSFESGTDVRQTGRLCTD